MADILDFTAKRKKRDPKPTVQQIIETSTDDLLNDWFRYAGRNQLEKLVQLVAAYYVRDDFTFLSDLNAVATLEKNVFIETQVSPPSFNAKNGWIASFKLDDGAVVSTPALSFETYARCFAVLLFLKIQRDLQHHGLAL